MFVVSVGSKRQILASTFQVKSVKREGIEQRLDLDGAELEAFLAANSKVMSPSFDEHEFMFALNELNQIQRKKFKKSVEFDKILLKTIDKLYS